MCSVENTVSRVEKARKETETGKVYVQGRTRVLEEQALGSREDWLLWF